MNKAIKTEIVIKDSVRDVSIYHSHTVRLRVKFHIGVS